MHPNIHPIHPFLSAKDSLKPSSWSPPEERHAEKDIPEIEQTQLDACEEDSLYDFISLISSGTILLQNYIVLLPSDLRNIPNRNHLISNHDVL